MADKAYIVVNYPEQFVGDYRIPKWLTLTKGQCVVGNIHENSELLKPRE